MWCRPWSRMYPIHIFLEPDCHWIDLGHYFLSLSPIYNTEVIIKSVQASKYIYNICNTGVLQLKPLLIFSQLNMFTRIRSRVCYYQLIYLWNTLKSAQKQPVETWKAFYILSFFYNIPRARFLKDITNSNSGLNDVDKICLFLHDLETCVTLRYLCLGILHGLL